MRDFDKCTSSRDMSGGGGDMCCIFGLGFGCCTHPIAGWNTFSTVYIYFFHFSDKKGMVEKEVFLQIHKAGQEPKAGRLLNIN